MRVYAHDAGSTTARANALKTPRYFYAIEQENSLKTCESERGSGIMVIKITDYLYANATA